MWRLSVLAVCILFVIDCAAAERITYQECLETLPYSVNVVSFVQTELKRAGFYRGTVDGKIGNATGLAIQHFREEKSLGGSQKIDLKLLSALMGADQYADAIKQLPVDRCEELRREELPRAGTGSVQMRK